MARSFSSALRAATPETASADPANAANGPGQTRSADGALIGSQAVRAGKVPLGTTTAAAPGPARPAPGARLEDTGAKDTGFGSTEGLGNGGRAAPANASLRPLPGLAGHPVSQSAAAIRPAGSRLGTSPFQEQLAKHTHGTELADAKGNAGMEAGAGSASRAETSGLGVPPGMQPANAGAAAGAPGSAGPSGMHQAPTAANLFSQMDSAALEGRATVNGPARRLEVSLPDSGAGPVGIEAHMSGGQVSASIQVEREQAMHLLNRELPAMQQFLSSSHVDLKEVSVSVGQQGTGQQGTGQQDAGQSWTGQPGQSPQGEAHAGGGQSEPSRISLDRETYSPQTPAGLAFAEPREGSGGFSVQA